MHLCDVFCAGCDLLWFGGDYVGCGVGLRLLAGEQAGSRTDNWTKIQYIELRTVELIDGGVYT